MSMAFATAFSAPGTAIVVMAVIVAMVMVFSEVDGEPCSQTLRDAKVVALVVALLREP